MNEVELKVTTSKEEILSIVMADEELEERYRQVLNNEAVVKRWKEVCRSISDAIAKQRMRKFKPKKLNDFFNKMLDEVAIEEEVWQTIEYSYVRNIIEGNIGKLFVAPCKTLKEVLMSHMDVKLMLEVINSAEEVKLEQIGELPDLVNSAEVIYAIIMEDDE